MAFCADGVLYLERMSVLAADGAGILCDTPLPKGAVVPLAFRLSTAKQAVRCRGEVLGSVATSPAGLKLHDRLGAQAFAKVATAGLGDSATVMFRLSDLEEQAREQRKPAALPLQPPSGFCVRFVDLDEVGQQAVTHHLQVSRRLSEQLAVRGGRLVEIGENERRTIARLFEEDEDLSKKALDW